LEKYLNVIFFDIIFRRYLTFYEEKSNNHYPYSKKNLGAYGLVVMTSTSHD